MSDPVFLTLEQVQRLHRKSIEIFGGSHGYRDKETLEGAQHLGVEVGGLDDLIYKPFLG